MGISASCVISNMNSLIFLSCLSLVLALPPPKYPTPAPTQHYNPDIGQKNEGGYGVNKDHYCHMVEKVVFENQCEPYTETTCYTQNVFVLMCTGGAELPFRAEENLRTLDEDSPQEGQEVQLHQGL